MRVVGFVYEMVWGDRRWCVRGGSPLVFGRGSGRNGGIGFAHLQNVKSLRVAHLNASNNAVYVYAISD